MVFPPLKYTCTPYFWQVLLRLFTSTYFTFQEKFYEQVEGAAMGSPISPIVGNLYMEDFEMRALNTAPQPAVLDWLKMQKKPDLKALLAEHASSKEGKLIIRN